MNVIVPKNKESHVGTPNTRITTPVIRPVTNALVGKAILQKLLSKLLHQMALSLGELYLEADGHGAGGST